MVKIHTRVKGDAVRLGVIGLGTMGRTHVDSLAAISEVRLAAVCDGVAETASTVGTRLGVPFFTLPSDLINSGLCDALLLVTPHPSRPPMAIEAMKKGLHILSEKPLAESVSAADSMIKAAKKYKVALGVMFNRRAEQIFIKAFEWVQSGALGTVCRTTLITPEYRTQAYYDSAAWRGTWKDEGGGVMFNQSPHMLDLFIKLGGMPCEVLGRCETRLHHIEVEDTGEAMLRYPEGGTGYFYCSTAESGPGQMLEIFGTHGKLTYRDGKLTLCRFSQSIPDFTRSTTKIWSAPECTQETVEMPQAESGHKDIIRNFARHLLLGETLIAPGEDGLKSLELANAAWLSTELGKPVKLPLNRRAYDKFLGKKRAESSFIK